MEGTSDEDFRQTFKRAPGTTPEQKFRYSAESLGVQSSKSVGSALEHLRQVVMEEGPFDGMIGNSEGACMAATFLVKESDSGQENKGQRMRCAVFMSGAPPLKPDGQGPYLADEYGQLIKIPTLHIIGFNDPTREATLALYHLCHQQSAEIVDHGKGHMIPRDGRSYQFIISGIRHLITRIKADGADG